MEVIIVACGLGFMTIIFGLCSYFIRTSERRFQENSLPLKGTVIGYSVRRHRGMLDSPYIPDIDVEVNGKHVVSHVMSTRMNPNDYPIGTILDVRYRRKRSAALGNVDEVRIDVDGLRGVSLVVFANIFMAVSLTLFAAAVIILIVGLKNA